MKSGSELGFTGEVGFVQKEVYKENRSSDVLWNE
jgi:hypothetical protein